MASTDASSAPKITKPPSSVPEPIFTLSKSHLRYLHSSDAERLAEIANNPNVSKYLRNIFPYPYTRADADKWLQKAATQVPRTQFSICANTTDEHGQAGDVIGGVGLARGSDVHSRTWELGYWLAEPYWGRGIVTEAARMMTNWGFETLGEDCQRIYGGAMGENEASARILQKVGFTYEGRLRASIWKHGKNSDQVMYSVIRSDWENEREKWSSPVV